MTVEDYQILVIGCGVAGRHVAWDLAKRGQKTVVVERSMVGGASFTWRVCPVRM